MKTVLNGYINAIIAKIKNGFDDVSTLTPDIDGIPFNLKNWIQISGPLFYGGSINDDIDVRICLDGCNSDRLEIYQKYGYRKENGDAAVRKYYKWSEIDSIAMEVEDIVVSLVGVSNANAFVSDDVYIEISRKYTAEANTKIQKHKKSSLITYVSIAILTPILLFLIAWIMGEI